MSDPIGQNSYAGLAVPLYGEAVIRQINSSNAILTLMHSSPNTGRLLMGLDYKELNADPSSLLTDLATFDIDAEGGLRMLSGTTVLMELNSSGLFDGSTQILNTAGDIIIRQPVVAMTTGANYSPTTAQSGTLFTAGTNNGTSQLVILPDAPTAGVWFDFYVSSQAETGEFVIATTGSDPTAKISLPGFTSAVSTGKNIQPLTTEGHNFVRMTAVSSILWMAHSVAGYAGAATTDFQLTELSAGHWGAASTAA